MAEPSLILYGTAACHLCEEAEAVLHRVRWPVVVAVDVIDISDDEQLLQRYGTRIPVLALIDAAGVRQELDWPFDAQAVQGLLP